MKRTASWWAVAAVLAAGSVGVALSQPQWPGLVDTLQWQRERLWSQPWRWWSAAFVHLGGIHLAANLAGCAVVAAFGIAAGLGRDAALAWCGAWPLTHLALALGGGVGRYAGLSGVLHAGLAVAVVFVVAQPGGGGRRWTGLAVAAGLLVKLGWEQAWTAPVQRLAGWEFPVVVAAHAWGTLAGALCGILALARGRRGKPTMSG